MNANDLQEAFDGVMELINILHNENKQTIAILHTAAAAIRKHNPAIAEDWATGIQALLRETGDSFGSLDQIETIDSILRGLPLPPKH